MVFISSETKDSLAITIYIQYTKGSKEIQDSEHWRSQKEHI